MDILRHARIAGFEGKAIVQGGLDRHAGLQGEVVLSLGVEPGHVQAGGEEKVTSQRDVVFRIERSVVAEEMFARLEEACQLVRLGLELICECLRDEVVPGVFGAELDQVAGRRRPVEVDAGSKVQNAGIVVDPVVVELPIARKSAFEQFVFHAVRHDHPVAVDGHGGVGKQPVVEDVVPTQGGYGASPFDADRLLVLHSGGLACLLVLIVRFVEHICLSMVGSPVDAQVEAVFVRSAPGQLAVEVIEEVVVIIVFEERM